MDLFSYFTTVLSAFYANQLKERQRLEYKIRRKRQQIRKRYHNAMIQNYIETLKTNYNLGQEIVNCFQPRRRTLWMKRRSNHWWTTLMTNFNEDDWLENFRMTKETFLFLCDALREHLTAKPNTIRTPLSVEKKVALVIYKLASCCEYRVVGNQFGVHKSTVHKCIYQVCDAIIVVFAKKFISLPKDEEVENVAKSFQDISKIPCIIGSIDGTHIPILPPGDGYRDFTNRKGWPSYNVQAVVDAHYRFRHVLCRHPGSTHDAAVLKDSAIYKYAEKLLPKKTRLVGDMEVPYCLVGDPAYPLLPWLLKGYKQTHNWPPDEESFNVYLNSARIVVENAFGRLKARWRCLLKRIDINYNYVPVVVLTCCVLHNIVEDRKDQFSPTWLTYVEQAELIQPQPSTQARCEFDTFDGSLIRDNLKVYMTKNYPLRKSCNF